MFPLFPLFPPRREPSRTRARNLRARLHAAREVSPPAKSGNSGNNRLNSCDGNVLRCSHRGDFGGNLLGTGPRKVGTIPTGDPGGAASATFRAEFPGTNHPARQLPPAGRGHTTGGKGATRMVSILAPRVAELETEAFQRRLEGRSQPRRRARGRQAAGKKGGA